MRDETKQQPLCEPVAKDNGNDFPQIWLFHLSYLRAHALRLSGGNIADAEDLLSEVALKATQAFSATAIRNRRAWLLRLMHNVVMDRERSERRRSRLDDDRDVDS